MKFTIAALLVTGSNAVMLHDDDGKGHWVNKGLPYDHDVPTLNKAEADNVAKTQAFNGATKADADAKAAAAASAAAEAATTAAVKTKEATLDAHLKAFDDKVEKDLISARKGRDLDAATAAKAASDANLLANQ